jgi:hypothetical protein
MSQGWDGLKPAIQDGFSIFAKHELLTELQYLDSKQLDILSLQYLDSF